MRMNKRGKVDEEKLNRKTHTLHPAVASIGYEHLERKSDGISE
jgi:hypothetical protein